MFSFSSSPKHYYHLEQRSVAGVLKGWEEGRKGWKTWNRKGLLMRIYQMDIVQQTQTQTPETEKIFLWELPNGQQTLFGFAGYGFTNHIIHIIY